MAIPTHEEIRLPLLRLAADGNEHRTRDFFAVLAEQFHLPPEERNEKLKSGEGKFANRVRWAGSNLRMAGLLEAPQRAFIRITERGRGVLDSGTPMITAKSLLEFPEYRAWRGMDESKPSSPSLVLARTETTTTTTPLERIEEARSELDATAARDILAKVKNSPPAFFERLVVDLLVKMGYGGSQSDAVGSVVGRSGDGGIDGIIKQDELGLDLIYLQAKRYTTANVPVGDIRDFVGALVNKRARKGVFITTSNFQKDARDSAHNIEGKTLVLIDGTQLAQLMIKHELGFSVKNTFKVGKIDEDYFDEDITS